MTRPRNMIQTLGFAEGTQCAERAERPGLDLAELQPVIDAEALLAPNVALALEAAGNSSGHCWVRIQAYYDLAQECLRRERSSAIPSGSRAPIPAPEPEPSAVAR